MIFVKSAAVADQISQHHLGVGFCGGVALAPVPAAKAQVFVSTVDSDAKLLTADQAESHLIKIVDAALESRSLVMQHLSEAITAAKSYLADLRKLAKDHATAVSIIAQADAYAGDLAAALAFDTETMPLRSARFLADHIEAVAIDVRAIRLKLTEMADVEASIRAGRDGLRDAISKINTIKAEATARADGTPTGQVIAPSVFAELAELRAATASLLSQIDSIHRKIGAAA